MTDAKARKLLERIFSCNADEFEILKRTTYDIKDLMKGVIQRKVSIPSIDDLVEEILNEGIIDITMYIDDRWEDLESSNEKESLEELDNIADFEIVSDREKSYLKIIRNEEIYKTYLMEIIKEAEKNMGFPIRFNA